MCEDANRQMMLMTLHKATFEALEAVQLICEFDDLV